MSNDKTCGLPECNGYTPCPVCEFDDFDPAATADALLQLVNPLGQPRTYNGARAEAAKIETNIGRGADNESMNRHDLIALAVHLARGYGRVRLSERGMIVDMLRSAENASNGLDTFGEAVSAIQTGRHVVDDGGPFVLDLVSHLERQRAFSERTFGPGQRVDGVLDHIVKEIDEVRANPSDLSEWIDIAILALDGAWRTGASSEQIAHALVKKQAKNENRTWPDWRTVPTGKAIEHVRTDVDDDALTLDKIDAIVASAFRASFPTIASSFKVEDHDGVPTITVPLSPDEIKPRPLRVYVASGFDNAESARDVINEVLADGHNITFDWTRYALDNVQRPSQAALAELEYDAVLNADAVIVVLPGMKGTHTEFGIALASPHVRELQLLAARSTVLADVPFYSHPKVVLCTGDERVQNACRRLARLARRLTIEEIRCHSCDNQATYAPAGSKRPVACWSHAGDWPEWHDVDGLPLF